MELRREVYVKNTANWVAVGFCLQLR